MIITKLVAVIVNDGKYLVARDKNEDFFKNVGGRIQSGESETDCLKRNLQLDIGVSLTEEPELLFEFSPTPAVGDPGHEVVLKGYLVKDVVQDFTLNGDVEEIAWVNSQNAHQYKLTPQILDLILPKLTESGLIT